MMPSDASSFTRLFVWTDSTSSAARSPTAVAPTRIHGECSEPPMRKPITMPGRTECESASPSSDVPRTTRKHPTSPSANETSMPCTTMGQYVSRPYVHPSGGAAFHQTQGLMMACQSAFICLLVAWASRPSASGYNRKCSGGTPEPHSCRAHKRHVFEVGDGLVADLRVDAVRRRVAAVGEQRAVLATRPQQPPRQLRDGVRRVTPSAELRGRVDHADADAARRRALPG